ncbi:class I SAM-dependent methyltransferase [[Clostridium] leptum]|uniref:Methyltransferase n=1 Tax=Solibaculum mannosilyticum TaxID=2780922 RepID=A0A7I8D661_9FIRM|nr:class I SAM-dependent methyltransferase [Solibaculum mannosilyticum]MCO7136993.1 class I SAM-dependent methyltransferase [[Clostridium] leptum]BCI60969.1 methyltransferase [Solibaculum mannosilyticum]
MSYEAFADFYDALTSNIDYSAWAEHLLRLFERHGQNPKLLLDLACGTGSLALELMDKRPDMEMICADGSEAMLSIARQKSLDAGKDLLFLHQSMQNIDLYGTVDGAVCTLDSLNHLVREEDVRRTLERVSLFLEPGCFFLFDVNTPYKHREILGNHAFVYDLPQVYCVWQCSYQEKKMEVSIDMDFFAKHGASYTRSGECFKERAYEHPTLCRWLGEAGLEVLEVLDGLTLDPPQEHTQRLVYVTRKM